MRQYQKRRRLHMLIAILMSLNIVSVGYATWAITGPSSDTTDGGNFQSYGVAYYTITIDPSFQAYHNKTQEDGPTLGFFIPEGDLESIKILGEDGYTLENSPSNKATLTLTYTAANTKTAEITTTVMFGTESFSEAFFTTVSIESITRKSDGKNFDPNYANGVLSFTFEPKDGDVIIITFNTNGNAFANSICDGTPRSFVVRTMVQDTN
jgi:hypothetical protein